MQVLHKAQQISHTSVVESFHLLLSKISERNKENTLNWLHRISYSTAIGLYAQIEVSR